MARHLYCTAPDGTVLKRRTDNDYAFAVVVETTDGWKAPKWSSSRQGAERGQSQAARWYGKAFIVPARTEAEEAS